MSKKAKIGIVAAVVILLAVLLYFFGFSSKKNYVTDDWTHTYQPEDQGPYGTYVLKELLDTTGLFGDFLELDEPLENALDNTEDVNDIYFFIGGKNYLADSTVTFLLDFIADGNTALIATETLPSELLNQITFDTEAIYSEKIIDTTQYQKFYHPDLKSKRYEFSYINQNKIKKKNWFYYDASNFFLDEGDTLMELGANTKDYVNFLKIKKGKGSLFLHSDPYLFTNVAMMRRDGFQYVEHILKHVPPGRIQWDVYNLQYHYRSSGNNNGNDNPGFNGDRESQLQFIMENPPLLWAFLILLIGAVLYALFKGKRMQRIVPAIESKENMSLQYVSTLSSLYLKERKHNKLVRLKEKTFLNFIADHYYIHTGKVDDQFVERLSIKSHVPKEKIEIIFDRFKKLESTYEVSDKDLIDLHQKIENFYKTCR